jgi:hypothetical protein
MTIHDLLNDIEVANKYIADLTERRRLRLSQYDFAANINDSDVPLLIVGGQAIATGSDEIQALADFITEMFNITGKKKEESMPGSGERGTTPPTDSMAAFFYAAGVRLQIGMQPTSDATDPKRKAKGKKRRPPTTRSRRRCG